MSTQVRLAWIVKQWHPGITTFSNGKGLVTAAIDGPHEASPFKTSHAAAAQWAARMLCASLDNFALCMRGHFPKDVCPRCLGRHTVNACAEAQ